MKDDWTQACSLVSFLAQSGRGLYPPYRAAPGVYVGVEAHVGLVKIGHTNNVERRVTDLRRGGADLRLGRVLWGAGPLEEGLLLLWSWKAAAEEEARAAGLPHPGEWRLPTDEVMVIAGCSPGVAS